MFHWLALMLGDSEKVRETVFNATDERESKIG